MEITLCPWGVLVVQTCSLGVHVPGSSAHSTSHTNATCSLRSPQLKKTEKHKTVSEKVTTLRNRDPAFRKQPEGVKDNSKNQLKHVGLLSFLRGAQFVSLP